MDFTLEEWQASQYVKQIPQGFLQARFLVSGGYTISDQLLGWLSMEPLEIYRTNPDIDSSTDPYINSFTDSRKNIINKWVCVCLKDSDFIENYKQPNYKIQLEQDKVTPVELLQIAVLAEKLPLIDDIVSYYSSKTSVIDNVGENDSEGSAAETFDFTQVLPVACATGNTDITDKIKTLSPSVVQDTVIKLNDAIKHNDSADIYMYDLGMVPMAMGNLAMMNWLFEQTEPFDWDHLIDAPKDSSPVVDMLMAGHFHILERLMELAAKYSDMFNCIVGEHYYLVLRYCASQEAIDKYLSYPGVLERIDFLSYQEQDLEDTLFESLHSSIARQVTRVREQLTRSNNMDDQTVNLCFYMARNIIRRNEEALQDDLTFLLDILKNRDLAHQYSNELLRLAIEKNNQSAAGSLYSIESVRILAERHEFYINYKERLDSRLIAQDQESSMYIFKRILPAQEEKYLARVTAHYKPIIAERGLDKLFTTFCEDLKGRADAENIYSYLMNNKQKYYYRDYDKELIVILWLAARDEAFEPMDGFTLETRITHFFHTLVDIERVHDYKANKSVCYRGMEAKLLQSVPGHSLLKEVTKDLIKQEIRDFVRECFQKKIANQNKDELNSAWESLHSREKTKDHLENPNTILARLNISEAEQGDFIKKLTIKYGDQLGASETKGSCIHYILERFELNKMYECHAAAFAGEVDLTQLLRKRSHSDTENLTSVIVSPDRAEPRPSGSGIVRAFARGSDLSQLGIFATSSSATENDGDKDEETSDSNRQSKKQKID